MRQSFDYAFGQLTRALHRGGGANGPTLLSKIIQGQRCEFSDHKFLYATSFDQAAISVEEPLHLNCVNLKSIRLTMNVSVAGLEDFLVFCSPTLEALDLKCVSTDMHPNELDFSKLATQSWKIKDLRLVLTNKLRGLNHYKDLKKFLKALQLSYKYPGK